MTESQRLDKIELPVGGNEVLEVDLDELQGVEEQDQIIGIMLEDRVALKFFVQFALECRKRGMWMAFEKFLKAGVSVLGENYALEQESSSLLILNCLTAHLVGLARGLGPGASWVYPEDASGTYAPRSREQLLEEATVLVNRASDFDQRDIMMLINKADLMLEKKDFDQANYTISNVLSIDPHYIPALFGKITVLNQKGDIKGCLHIYQTIFKIEPELEPDLRLPIGICFNQLGMTKEAKKSFERAIARNPKNVDALALLSILHSNLSKDSSLSQETLTSHRKHGSQYIMRAFQLNNKNPIVALEMGKRFFEKGQYDKALVLVETSLRHSDMNLLKCDATFLKALILQAQAKYDDALTLLEEAVAMNPKSLLIDYGLGQLFIHKGETEKAMQHLEKVVAKEPENYETIKKLASLYSESLDTRPKSFVYFDKLKRLMKQYRADEVGPGRDLREHEYMSDYEVLIEWAYLLEDTDPALATKYYDQALQVMRNTEGVQIPAELLNNVAVLNQIQLDASRKDPAAMDTIQVLYAEALRNIERAAEASGDMTEDMEANRLTIQFNIAVFYEESGQKVKAENMYLDLVKKYPAYTDCLLRLAILRLKDHRFPEAIDILKEIVAVDKRNEDAWCLLARAQMDARQVKEAQHSLDYVLKSLDKFNTYALCSLANLYFWKYRHVVDRKDAKEPLMAAYRNYDRALDLKAYNSYAAAGMGIVCAERGDFQKAREILSLVHEASPSTTVALNLAHTLTELNQVKQAAILFESTLKKTVGLESVPILECLAKCHYVLGKQEKTASHLLESRRCLERCLHLEAGRKSALFNLALVKQQYALILSEQPLERRSIDAMNAALPGLTESAAVMEELSKGEKGQGYSTSRAAERAKMAAQIITLVTRKVHETEVLERQKRERLEDMKEARQKAEQLKIDMERHKQKEALRIEEEIQRKREELKQRVKEENEKARAIIDEERERERERKPKRSKTLDEDPGDSLDEEVVEAREKKAAAPRQKKKRVRTEVVESSSSEGEADSAEAAPAPKRPQEGRASTLSKAIIEDSDEEDNTVAS